MKISVVAVVLASACVAHSAAAEERPAPEGPAVQEPRGGEQTERITRKLRLGPNGRLSVSNLAGEIAVTGVGGDEVTIEAVKRTRGSRDDLAGVVVNIEERQGRISVETEYPPRARGRNRSGVSVDFTISVPAGTSVDMESLSGTIRVTGVTGVVRGETMSGNVVAVKSPRIERAESVSGTIDLSDADVEGILEASTMSGNIRARSVKARRLHLSTVSGSIDIDNVESDRVEIKSMSGNLAFGGSLAPDGRYLLSSHSGNVQLSLSSTVGFELNASSFSGTVRSDFPVTLGSGSSGGNSTDSRGRRGGRGPSSRSMRAVFGDGSAMLEVSTFSGDISLTRK